MIIPFMAGIKNRIGFNKKLISKKRGHNLLSVFFTHSIVDVPDTEKRVKKNLDLLKEINIKNNNYDYDLDLNKKAIKNKKLIGIHPGSDNNGKIKRWDIRKFNKLAQIIISELNYKVKFYIGPQDRESIKCIDEGSDIKIVKNKSLIETIEDISSCSYFISNDSGLSHISAALKIPTLVIFGPTTKDEYILPTKFLPVENNNLECRPCWYKSRGKECNYNIDCLKSISVLDVYDGLLALMKKS
jgi:ADP-heptose:LPS heptosyltransferase